jgi:hypothetical protein
LPLGGGLVALSRSPFRNSVFIDCHSYIDSGGTVVAEPRVLQTVVEIFPRRRLMIMTNKLLPVALVAALIGGTVGAFVMHSSKTTAESQPATFETSRNPDVQFARYQTGAAGREENIPSGFETSAEQTAYKSGFADGFRACQGGANGTQFSSGSVAYNQPRVVYRNTTAARTVARNSSSTRRVYYDYQQPRKRSFWNKHRDKLTVAMGAGGGAALGALFGGKKGAAIGALAGGGGSALNTYKLRNRNRRY